MALNISSARKEGTNLYKSDHPFMIPWHLLVIRNEYTDLVSTQYYVELSNVVTGDFCNTFLFIPRKFSERILVT